MANLQEIKKNTVDVAESRIRNMMEEGEINLPEDYSVGNALKSAWLKLQETKDKNGKPALKSCTRTSIVNAMLDTTIQGLNPSKDQVYYVVYGKKLVAMRSYFGNMALAKRVDEDIVDIWAEVIYEGDEVDVKVERGQRYIAEHKSQWDNQDDDKVAGVYATIEYENKRNKQVIMTIDECKEAWNQGIPYNENNKKDTHNKFTAEMAKKTAINRVTKKVIKSSSDNYLFKASVDRADDAFTEEKTEKDIKENQNTVTVDTETGEIIEGEPENEREAKDVTEEKEDDDITEEDYENIDEDLGDFKGKKPF